MAKSESTVSKNRAIKIFKALAFKTADQWDIARLQNKLSKLHNLIEGAELDDKTQKRVNAILRAQENGEVVKVVDPEKADEGTQIEKGLAESKQRLAADKKEKNDKAVRETKRESKKEKDEEMKANKKANKKAVKKKVKKTAKKKTPKKTPKKKLSEKTAKKTVKKEKKPGVIMSMLEFVREHGPVSEKKIHSLLKKRFPNKNPDSMGRSIPQIPRYLVRKKNIDVIGKDDKGRYCIKK